MPITTANPNKNMPGHASRPFTPATMQQFRFLYTTRQVGTPSGVPTKRTRTVSGMNKLDAQTRLTKLAFKEGHRIHTILNWVAVPKGQKATATSVEYA
jgi:hypothetical protein